jgi:mono/diheme cytochrome c family protein
VAVLVALVLALVVLAGEPLLVAREDNAILRGRRLAAREGCLDCHQPTGDEIPNPGSRWGTVPRFGGGNAFMYVKDRGEMAEMIRLGATRAELADPVVRARLQAQPVRMPAFGQRLSRREIDELTAWAAAMEGMGLHGDEKAQAGRDLARAQGCTSCHGVEGSGGMPNPGALGGIVPGFAGGNFADLVHDEAEFREWVETGTSRRVAHNAIARWVWKRQRVAMPAYRGRLTAQQIDQLWGWVQALRASAAR